MADSRRSYRLMVDCAYAGGTLPADTADALERVLRAGAHGLTEVRFVVVPGDRSVVRVTAIVRAANPVAAVTVANASLDDALAATGLFEEFDVTGKAIQVAPV